jgi:hypothetical protein
VESICVTALPTSLFVARHRDMTDQFDELSDPLLDLGELAARFIDER